MDLEGITRAGQAGAPHHGVRFGRPDPLWQPESYMTWLLGSGSPTPEPGGKLQTLILPMVEDIYTIGPKAAPADRKWLVVVTEPQRERSVADDLTRDGIETYVPMRKAFSKPRNRKCSVITRALFPGYAFAWLAEAAGSISVIMAADGAMSVLPRPDAPLGVSGPEIERLRRLEDAGEFDETQEGLRKGWNKAKPTGALSWICKGAKILVTDGPFASFPAIIQAVDAGRRRVKAEILIFAQRTPVELEYAQFRKA